MKRSWWARIGLVVLVLFVVGPVLRADEPAAGGDEKPKFQWYDSLEKAIEVAKKESKPILLNFHSSVYMASKTMDRALHSKKTKEFVQKFVCVQVQTKKAKELCKKFEVTKAPFTIILNSEGRPYKDLPGSNASLNEKDLVKHLEETWKRVVKLEEMASTKIDWVEDYEKALAQAKAEGKPIFIYFGATW